MLLLDAVLPHTYEHVTWDKTCWGGYPLHVAHEKQCWPFNMTGMQNW